MLNIGDKRTISQYGEKNKDCDLNVNSLGPKKRKVASSTQMVDKSNDDTINENESFKKKKLNRNLENSTVDYVTLNNVINILDDSDQEDQCDGNAEAAQWAHEKSAQSSPDIHASLEDAYVGYSDDQEEEDDDDDVIIVNDNNFKPKYGGKTKFRVEDYITSMPRNDISQYDPLSVEEESLKLYGIINPTQPTKVTNEHFDTEYFQNNMKKKIKRENKLLQRYDKIKNQHPNTQNYPSPKKTKGRHDKMKNERDHLKVKKKALKSKERNNQQTSWRGFKVKDRVHKFFH